MGVISSLMGFKDDYKELLLSRLEGEEEEPLSFRSTIINCKLLGLMDSSKLPFLWKASLYSVRVILQFVDSDIMKSVPSFTSLLTLIVPPNAFTRSLQMVSPRPTPDLLTI